jgi:hypothetical protein
MALNVKPLYPFDHPEVTHPEMEVDKVEPSAVKNRFNPPGEDKNQETYEEKLIETSLKKRLDILS